MKCKLRWWSASTSAAIHPCAPRPPRPGLVTFPAAAGHLGHLEARTCACQVLGQPDCMGSIRRNDRVAQPG
eukprot:869341-Pyramimonas_sp.AAC.1